MRPNLIALAKYFPKPEPKLIEHVIHEGPGVIHGAFISNNYCLLVQCEVGGGGGVTVLLPSGKGGGGQSDKLSHDCISTGSYCTGRKFRRSMIRPAPKKGCSYSTLVHFAHGS